MASISLEFRHPKILNRAGVDTGMCYSLGTIFQDGNQRAHSAFSMWLIDWFGQALGLLDLCLGLLKISNCCMT